MEKSHHPIISGTLSAIITAFLEHDFCQYWPHGLPSAHKHEQRAQMRGPIHTRNALPLSTWFRTNPEEPITHPSDAREAIGERFIGPLKSLRVDWHTYPRRLFGDEVTTLGANSKSGTEVDREWEGLRGQQGSKINKVIWRTGKPSHRINMWKSRELWKNKVYPGNIRWSLAAEVMSD